MFSHLELMQIAKPAYEVILQVQDLEVWTDLPECLNLFNVLLVQGDLLQS